MIDHAPNPDWITHREAIEEMLRHGLTPEKARRQMRDHLEGALNTVAGFLALEGRPPIVPELLADQLAAAMRAGTTLATLAALALGELPGLDYDPAEVIDFQPPAAEEGGAP
jgi:hypothetical protein